MKSLRTILFRDKIGAKYSDLFRELLNAEGISICNYVSRKGASLLPYSSNFVASGWWARRECRLALELNGINRKKIKILTCPEEIKEDDIVISFVHIRGQINDLPLIKAKKVLHLNQYCYHPVSVLKENKIGIDCFVAESDLLKIKGLFSDNCSHLNAGFIQLPYSYSERFRNVKTFAERRNKALATGTIGMCREKDFIEYYGTEYLHGPMRFDIYEHQQELLPYLDSVISPFEEHKNKKPIRVNDCFFQRYYKYLYMFFHPVQKKYFSFNIVEKYNDYRMCIVPEEIVGVPAIGTFEGMACGCAAIALDHCMYTDLGLIPGVHYIPYDGTLESLKDKIVYYQQHEQELEQIARKGYEFVTNHFTASKIAQCFVEALKDRYIK